MDTAVDWDSLEILEELLELAHRSRCVPRPNSGVLTKACGKDDYDLVKPLVERGYRLRPHMLAKNKSTEKKRTIAQLILQGENSIVKHFGLSFSSKNRDRTSSRWSSQN